MLTRNIRYVHFLVLILMVSLCQICPAVTVKFEAEDSVITGIQEFGDTIAGYSGTGYINLTGAGGTGLNFTVNARDAGNYPLTLRYHQPWGASKTQEIWVNNVMVDSHGFTLTSTWTDYVFGNVSLNAGDNLIQILIDWSWVAHDYITLDGFPDTATDPVPPSPSTVSTDLTQLCWTNPDPNNMGHTITSDVYWSEGNNDVNTVNFRYHIDQATGKVTAIATGTSNTCVTIPSTPLEPFTTYYWVVDSWYSESGSPVLLPGYVWEFNTNNTVPDPNAGLDQYIWLGNDGDPNSATATLDASQTTDDGLPSGTLNYIWQQVSGAAGVIVNPYDTVSTSINLSAAGTYKFRLTVDDTVLEAEDTVVVTVYASSCEAAKADPGFVGLDAGDITEDCYVGFEDILALTWYWLECNSLAPCN